MKCMYAVLNKNLNSSLPFRQASLRICLPEPISHLPVFQEKLHQNILQNVLEMVVLSDCVTDKSTDKKVRPD